MLPAHEGLEARHPVVAQVDDRLVVHDEAALVDRPAEAGLGVEAVERPVAEGVVEDLGPVPAAGLRPVHGGVGVPDERVGPAHAGLVVGDADAQGDHQLVVADGDGSPHRLLDPFGQHDGVPGRGQVGAEEHELVAAEAGHGVAGADALGQALGDLEQDLVGPLGAEALVDDLEAVEVTAQDGHAGGQAGAAGQGHAQPVHQQGAVGQAGQLVVGEVVLEAGLPAPGLGQVAGDRRDPLDPPVGSPVGDQDAEDGDLVAMAGQGQLALPAPPGPERGLDLVLVALHRPAGRRAPDGGGRCRRRCRRTRWPRGWRRPAARPGPRS